jgi:hypothetical protein
MFLRKKLLVVALGSVSFYFFLPFSHVILSHVQNLNDTDPFNHGARRRGEID